MTERALIYCRVSSRSQVSDGNGLDSQETRCRQYAALKGYDVAAVFPDAVSGGGDYMKRPGMVSLLAYLDAHPDEQFVVVFDDLKRYARDVEFHLKLRREMDARGARRECLNFNFDDTPEGEFCELIVAAQGQMERKQNARQVEQKMRARMENGYWLHTAPIGFRYQKVPGRGKMLFPDAPADAVIREAFERFASGRLTSMAEVTRFFAQHPNYPAAERAKITQHQATRIMTNPLYAGYIVSEHYGIKWLKGQHEPLISLETFEKAQKRRKNGTYAPTLDTTSRFVASLPVRPVTRHCGRPGARESTSDTPTISARRRAATPTASRSRATKSKPKSGT